MKLVIDIESWYKFICLLSFYIGGEKLFKWTFHKFKNQGIKVYFRKQKDN